MKIRDFYELVRQTRNIQKVMPTMKRVTMTTSEIEKAAKEYAQYRTIPAAGYIINSYNGFISGATMVNEIQPYSKEDMKKFLYDYIKEVQDEFSEINLEYLDFIKDRFIKLWEESKNG